ncbi:hypothetical protein GGH95_000555 [Coemansia sp. RSA 1836]|nr:hypothetical protein GGH95_000555 [Coemansia sp. RSA 1836]
MVNLSVFQLLPPHVVKMIADHVAGCIRLRFGGFYEDSDEYKLLLMPLLWLDYPTHHLAKKLIYHASFWSVYSGRALQRLSGAPYEVCAFPLVRQLTISLSWYDKHRQDFGSYSPDGLDSYPPDTTTNIAAFVQRVKQMAPNIREVDMRYCPDIRKLVKRHDTHMVDLVQQLYDIVKAKTTITYNSESLVEYIDLDLIRSNLVRVDYCINVASSRIMPLVRRSAQTLQSLKVTVVAPIDYIELIWDPDSGGRWMEYPRLHTLRLYPKYETVISRSSISSGAVLFPNLSHLGIHGFYPFCDDVLFRGNAATLESLKFWLNLATVALLKRLKAFTPTSHPKLQWVNVNLPPYVATRTFASVAGYLQFALSIAPGAAVRTVDDLAGVKEGIPQALGMFGNHAKIQLLSLNEVLLSIWDVISLIKSLPLLSHLESGMLTLGTHPQGVSMAMLPGYLRSTYAPIGKRFRCWRLRYYYPYINYAEVATCALLLALICPGFDYAALPGGGREPFMKETEKQIAEPRFIQYAPRLRRLLFNGWNDC